MKVVLDTNQLFGDYLLQNPGFSTLRDGLLQSGGELCVPEVVVEEIVRKYLQDYAGAITARNRVNRIAGVIGSTLPNLESEETAESRYRDALSKRLKELGARVLKLPKIGVDEVLERDLAERRPFDEKGRGFRDALIWESILSDMGDHEEPVALISNDGGFTAPGGGEGGKTELHDDLADDLESAGYNRERVKVFKSVQDFNLALFSQTPGKTYAGDRAPAGSFAEELDADLMRSQFAGAAQDEILRLLPWILRIRGAWDAEVSFIRWVGDARVLEAIDLGDAKAQVIVRTRTLFDSRFRVDDDELDSLWRYSKGKTIWLSDMRWDPEMRVFRYEARVLMFTDIVFRWNLDSGVSEGAAILRFGFDEDDMQVM